MEKLEKIILDTVVDNLVEQLERMDLFEEGFEFAEKYIETLIFKLANKVLQQLVNIKTKKIGFENHLTLSHHGCIRKYKSNSQMSHLNIQTLFGNISMEYKNYYNKTSKSSIKINCVNFKEHDTVSPNVKKKIVLLTPFDFFEDANIKLYNLTNINLSLSTLKRITNSVSEKNNDWLKEKIILKNKQFYNESKKAQADRIVISNDGGRFKNINFSEKGRNAKRNPEWKEAKAGVVFEVNSDGKKINNSYYYGGFEKQWQDLEAHLKYATNRFGLYKCKQFETISDCGNGIKQMYERNFSLPDNKTYFDVTDFYHTTEYLWELGKKIFPNNININEASENCKKWVNNCIEILLTSGGKKLIEHFKLEKHDNEILNKNFEKLTIYFTNNYERMNYHILKKNNLPIGSGEMEASIKKIINKRFKRNNIYWKTDNADNLFNLACTILNGDFEDFWKDSYKYKNYWFNIKDVS